MSMPPMPTDAQQMGVPTDAVMPGPSAQATYPGVPASLNQAPAPVPTPSTSPYTGVGAPMTTQNEIPNGIPQGKADDVEDV